MMLEIGATLRHTIFSSKFDLATRKDRHILGLSVQFISQWKIVIRHIGMVAMWRKCTADAILDEIEMLIQTLYIPTANIFSTTTDNGANVLSAARKLLDKIDWDLTQRAEVAENGSNANANADYDPDAIREFEPFRVMENFVPEVEYSMEIDDDLEEEETEEFGGGIDSSSTSGSEFETPSYDQLDVTIDKGTLFLPGTIEAPSIINKAKWGSVW